MSFSIVIPAYNEEDRIQKTLHETAAWLEKNAMDAEILVVSDGSRDGTRQVVETFKGPASLTIRCLEYFPNRGKGYAVRYGMLRAMGERILFMDADYSVPASFIPRAMEEMDRGADIAMASRAIPGADISRHQKPLREMAGKFYTLIQNFYLGMDYPDTQCGFKIFSRKASQNLFSRQQLHSVIFDPEILYLARRLNYRVAQFPVTWTHQENSRIKYDTLGKTLAVFRELFKIRGLHKKLGRHDIG
ncbi:glycosyltransferase involved in cell wall biosynthesis [Desulfobotulus alkaliphilus]|uniref:dolichyl-phosphate beta-glucosyltransferase n=1 Tax=Desulfobotulus alkaliphilus TaxID=622671 RepID=A0A562RZ17_9BACT|nr:dolichyl-phosphate beta-glucosyltransferase [Desulfobotulus alkaliphilus]TWI74389.1 glycosyltransferase involved in cell wall biosynthesis [Desulfobotulus alkaliphilus]